MTNNLSTLVEYKLNLDKIYTKLTDLGAKVVPTSDRIVLAHQRQMISPMRWRKLKANIQTLAGRSIFALEKSFNKKLTDLLQEKLSDEDALREERLYYIEQEINALFKVYFLKAYHYGIKASGLGISKNLNQFQRLSKPSPFSEANTNISKNIESAQKLFINSVLKTKQKEVPIVFLRYLHYQYDIGRLRGSPSNSVVYWKKEPMRLCKLCSYMEEMSPWTVEHLPIVPFNCNKCLSSMRIIPKKSYEYNEILQRFTNAKLINSRVKKLLFAQ